MMSNHQMPVLHLAWLAVLWLSSAAGYTQTDFNGALKARNLGLLRDILFVSNKRDVDPSIDDCKVLHLACDEGEVSLVETLLSDERIDPTSKDNDAIRRAARSLQHRVCNLLLRDPRVPADLIFDTPWLHQSINQSFIHEIRNIPKDVYCACATGDSEALRETELKTLDLGHFDLLLQRADQHPGVKAALHREQLRLLGAPYSAYSDLSTLNFVVSLGTRHPIVIKRALRIRSLLLMTLKMMPVEIINIMTKKTFENLVFFPLIGSPSFKLASRTCLISIPTTSLLSFMYIDCQFELSVAFPLLKWVGRALVIWNLASLCLAILPFNRIPFEDISPLRAISIWFTRTLVNFFILIALLVYIIK